MKEVYSNGEDVMWLAQEMKNIMDGYVSFNKFGIDNPILTGVYCADGNGTNWYGERDIRFYIKFCKKEFLRVQIPLGAHKDEYIVDAMEAIINALDKINCDGENIGFPLAIYKTDDSLTAEYNFKQKDETLQKLQENTMFDDGDVEGLHLVNQKDKKIKVYCKEIVSVKQ